MTAQRTHTPGPWVVDWDSRTATVRTCMGRAVARCYQGDDDASLIAAAPELLAAARALLAQIIETSAYDDAQSGEDDGLLRDVEAARAAIAKAEGRS